MERPPWPLIPTEQGPLYSISEASLERLEKEVEESSNLELFQMNTDMNVLKSS